MRVGNRAKGVEEQPDYDAEAEQVHAAVANVLPVPLPNAKDACSQMLAAVRRTYLEREGAGGAVLVDLDATRDADQVACEKETQPAAASCVTILAERDGGEFPGLLDQCTRAFR